MIDHVSDTALWVAWYRAQETELFRDSLAARLAGADSVRRPAPLPFPWNAVRAVLPGFVRRKGNETYG